MIVVYPELSRAQIKILSIEKHLVKINGKAGDYMASFS